MAEEDVWDPFADPEGQAAIQPPAAPADDFPPDLPPDERRALAAARAGEPLRQVEIDRLVRRGLGVRDKNGDFRLNEPGVLPRNRPEE